MRLAVLDSTFLSLSSSMYLLNNTVGSKAVSKKQWYQLSLNRSVSTPFSLGMDWQVFQHYARSAFLFFLFSFVIIQCGLDIEDPTPPSPPTWIQKSLPEEWPERGIDAVEGGGIHLEWEAKNSDEVLFYRLYRATYFEVEDIVSPFDLIWEVAAENGRLGQYDDINVQTGLQYWYKTTAEDATGSVSDYSDSISYTLLPQLNADFMLPSGTYDLLPETRYLSWRYSPGISMEDYCLTIIDGADQLIMRVRFAPGNYIGHEEFYEIHESIELQEDTQYKWRLDIGADYFNERERSGSESVWLTFSY
jgi:hypothetical protein